MTLLLDGVPPPSPEVRKFPILLTVGENIGELGNTTSQAEIGSYKTFLVTQVWFRIPLVIIGTNLCLLIGENVASVAKIIYFSGLWCPHPGWEVHGPTIGCVHSNGGVNFIVRAPIPCILRWRGSAIWVLARPSMSFLSKYMIALLGPGGRGGVERIFNCSKDLV